MTHSKIGCNECSVCRHTCSTNNLAISSFLCNTWGKIRIPSPINNFWNSIHSFVRFKTIHFSNASWRYVVFSASLSSFLCRTRWNMSTLILLIRSEKGMNCKETFHVVNITFREMVHYSSLKCIYLKSIIFFLAFNHFNFHQFKSTSLNTPK